MDSIYKGLNKAIKCGLNQAKKAQKECEKKSWTTEDYFLSKAIDVQMGLERQAKNFFFSRKSFW